MDLVQCVFRCDFVRSSGKNEKALSSYSILSGKSPAATAMRARRKMRGAAARAFSDWSTPL
jgi:hypothetical protein